MARRVHPDRFDRKTVAAFKAPIDEVFDGITNAYRVLSNKDKRAAYDSGASTGGGPEPEAQDSAKRADIKFRQGKTLYGMDRFDEAVAFLEEAVRLRRDKADYYLLLAMAESRIPAYLRKAETDYQKAITLEPWNPEAFVGLGVLYKEAGLQMKAIRQFEKALEADPDHAKARQELNDLTGKDKKKGLQGLFSMDFLGGKDKKKKK